MNSRIRGNGSGTTAGWTKHVLPPLVASGLIPRQIQAAANGTLELNVGIHMDSGGGKLEPDPVGTVYSVWEGVAVQYEHKVRRIVAISVNGSIYS